MTPEQEAALVDALRGLYEHTAEYIRINNLGDVHHNAVMKQARAALAALNGEGEREVWGAVERRPGRWAVMRFLDGLSDSCVCDNVTESTARQIAADHNTRAKLERAAREVVVAYDHGAMHPTESVAIANLRAALSDEGTP
jgi:hypothetical protein